MKKIALCLSVLALIATVSCKKDDKKTTVSNTWTFDGTDYTSVSSSANDNAYAFTSSSLGSVAFYFKDYPKTSGTYRVNTDIDVAADEVDILVGSFTPSVVVGSNHSGGGTVTVTVEGSKTTISCKGVPIEKSTGSGDPIGTTTLTANLSITR